MSLHLVPVDWKDVRESRLWASRHVHASRRDRSQPPGSWLASLARGLRARAGTPHRALATTGPTSRPSARYGRRHESYLAPHPRTRDRQMADATRWRVASLLMRAELVGMTTTITLVPPAAFISMNDRLHHMVKAKLTKAWREAACAAILSGFHPHHYTRARIVVAYRFPTNRRRECSNLQPTSKAIVDGLVDANLLPDDSDNEVVGPDNRRSYPNGSPLVTVTIEEIP